MQHRRSSCSQCSQLDGHTLIEMAAVVVVLAILAAAIVPVVIRRMDGAAWTKEVNDMGAISNAIALQIVRNAAVPNQANWAATTADWVMRPVAQISTNNRGFARLFLYDAGGWMTNAPYTQTSTGTGATVPANARIVIVSTIATALPYTNGVISTTNFNSIWNAAPHTKPSFFSGWTGNGNDLVIQRITLDPLFHRLILVNRDPTPSPASYSVNSTNVTYLSNLVSSYYLHGTTVGLNTNTTPAWRFVLTGDISYAFDGGLWRSTFSGGGKDNTAVAKTFVNQATTFISGSSLPPGAAPGSTPQGALSAMYSFMYSFSLWANRCPHYYYNGNPTSEAEYQILNALAANNGIIDSTAGKNTGLLK